MKTQIKCIVFDLDGTLLNTLTDLHQSVNHSLRRNNLPERNQDEVRGFVGNGIRKLIERSVPTGMDIEVINQVFSDFAEYYTEHCEDNTRPYAGIPKLLDTLKTKGIKTAILSNKAQFAVTKLHEKFFKDTIDLAFGESNIILRKPNPLGLTHAINALSVTKDETIYIGDSEVDILTAKNAEIQHISVTWGFRDKEFLIENGATSLVGEPKAILEFI